MPRADKKAKANRPTATPYRPPTTEEMKDVVRAWAKKYHRGAFEMDVTTWNELGCSEVTEKVVDPDAPDPMAALVAGAQAVMRQYPGAKSAALIVTAGDHHIASINFDPDTAPALPGRNPLKLLAAGAWEVMKASPRADDAALVVDFGPNKSAAVVPIFPEEKRPKSLADLPAPLRPVPPFPKRRKPAKKK